MEGLENLVHTFRTKTVAFYKCELKLLELLFLHIPYKEVILCLKNSVGASYYFSPHRSVAYGHFRNQLRHHKLLRLIEAIMMTITQY